MNNLKKISCLEPISSINILDGTVAFYFKDSTMTHAARYVDSIQAWTSKLGQSFLVWHGLDDLNGGSYGQHLCYALPGTIENHDINIDGSIQSIT